MRVLSSRGGPGNLEEGPLKVDYNLIRIWDGWRFYITFRRKLINKRSMVLWFNLGGRASQKWWIFGRPRTNFSSRIKGLWPQPILFIGRPHYVGSIYFYPTWLGTNVDNNTQSKPILNMRHGIINYTTQVDEIVPCMLIAGMAWHKYPNAFDIIAWQNFSFQGQIKMAQRLDFIHKYHKLSLKPPRHINKNPLFSCIK